MTTPVANSTPESKLLNRVQRYARRWALKCGGSPDDMAQEACIIGLTFLRKHGPPEIPEQWAHFWRTVKEGIKKYGYEDSLVPVPWSSDAERLKRVPGLTEPTSDNFIRLVDLFLDLPTQQTSKLVVGLLLQGCSAREIYKQGISRWQLQQELQKLRTRLKDHT